MGKKKKGVKKTKDISIALAESAATEPESQTPRKRGRPRKIFTEEKDDSNKERTGKAGEEGGEKERKIEEIEEVVAGSSLESKRDEEEERETLKQEEGPRRSRRKCKLPRKSS